MGNDSTERQVIPYYAHPHVHTVIFDNTWYDETVAQPRDPNDLPYATLVVIGADTGIDNTFVRVSDFNTKKALFGQGNFQKYGQPSLQCDLLFNGSTNVWICRVLPDNAQYANMILVAKYRKGNELDDIDQETGLKRLEIKFDVKYATKPALTDGPIDDDSIYEIAKTYEKATPDPQTGYMSVPICYIRSIGRGKYGNRYSVVFRRDTEAEKEYTLKMYKFGLVNNSDSGISRVTHIFSGSLYQTIRYDMSTLISDVLDQFETGRCPISIYPFEENFEVLYTFYKDIVAENAAYLEAIGGGTDDQAEDLEYAQGIVRDTFDPLFGYRIVTRSNQIIPYYRNYTVKTVDGLEYPYIAPELEVSNASRIPRNIGTWNTAKVGAALLVLADENNGGYRWRYNVISIDEATGNIVYDDGVEAAIDDAEYDGINIANAAGIRLIGGHDGDFQEITVNGVTRAPTNSEMKLLLSREYVKAFRGEKDRKVLSPARVNCDLIFDANYNMCSEGDLTLDDSIQAMYSNSTVLTDEDYAELSVIARSGDPLDFTDLNVKAAMYDLNLFRIKNGMEVANNEEDYGAGTLLHLDCGLCGIKNVNASSELRDIIKMFEGFTGRATSIDLGYYEIFDPYTGKRIKVTTSYFLAQRLIPHLIQNGINKPFTNALAQITCLQRSTALKGEGKNAMIRDTFRPDIDLIDWDVKELLYTSRINYYLTKEEGRNVQRSVQNTRQINASVLLEESNVRVLNTLKKGLEKACNSYLYDWNEPEARKGYTDTQMAVYRPWIGTIVQDIDIRFEANEWEQERMIMHCYCDVKFRDIVKRIILEININRPEY